VVEDDGAIRAIVTEVLAERGHEVSVMEEAEEALALLHRNHYLIMLLDWLLPGIDGLELCRRVRQRRDGDASVIVVTTARVAVGDELTAVLDAGAGDYLAKPFDLRLLEVRLTVAERHVAAIQARRRAEAALRDTWRMQAARRWAMCTGGRWLGGSVAAMAPATPSVTQAPTVTSRSSKGRCSRYLPIASKSRFGTIPSADVSLFVKLNIAAVSTTSKMSSSDRPCFRSASTSSGVHECASRVTFNA